MERGKASPEGIPTRFPSSPSSSDRCQPHASALRASVPPHQARPGMHMGMGVGRSPCPVSPLSGACLPTEQCRPILKTRSPEIRTSKASPLSWKVILPLWDFKVYCPPGWLTWVQRVRIRVLVAAADPALVRSGDLC